MSDPKKPKLVKRKVEIIVGEGGPPMPLGFIEVWMYPHWNGLDEHTVWRLPARPRQRHKREDFDDEYD